MQYSSDFFTFKIDKNENWVILLTEEVFPLGKHVERPAHGSQKTSAYPNPQVSNRSKPALNTCGNGGGNMPDDYGSTNLLNKINTNSTDYLFEYDANGNQTKENTNRYFEWDHSDQMRAFFDKPGATSEPTVYTHYLYDAAGNRVKKITRNDSGIYKITIYIDGVFEHIYEYDGSSRSKEKNEIHIMDDKSRIAIKWIGHDDDTPQVKYVFEDHLGSSTFVMEGNGSYYNREEYFPFGETSFGSFSKKRYRYVGKEKDEESGLYYYGARYYSAWVCRFISTDPLFQNYAYLSPYTYAGNKPINSIDAEGLGGTENKDTSNITNSGGGNNDQTFISGSGFIETKVDNTKVVIIGIHPVDNTDAEIRIDNPESIGEYLHNSDVTFNSPRTPEGTYLKIKVTAKIEKSIGVSSGAFNAKSGVSYEFASVELLVGTEEAFLNVEFFNPDESAKVFTEAGISSLAKTKFTASIPVQSGQSIGGESETTFLGLKFKFDPSVANSGEFSISIIDKSADVKIGAFTVSGNFSISVENLPEIKIDKPPQMSEEAVGIDWGGKARQQYAKYRELRIADKNKLSLQFKREIYSRYK